MIDCVTANSSFGCDGGDPTAAYSWILANGIPDWCVMTSSISSAEPRRTCTNYLALTQTCTAENQCKTCNPDGTCTAITNPPKINIAEHGQAFGVAPMQAELFARGPIGT